MTGSRHRLLLAASLAIAGTLPIAAGNPAFAAPAGVQELNRDSDQALQRLYETQPSAAALSRNAKAILIFPNIVKAGLIFGGAYGEGVLRQDSTIDGYYNSVTGSFGWQAGAQSYGDAAGGEGGVSQHV